MANEMKTLTLKTEDGLSEQYEVVDATAREKLDNLAKPDWNENNPESDAYIQNRPFYGEEGGIVEVLPEYTITEENSEADMAAIPALGLVAGETYVVTWNGTEYTCVAWGLTEEGITVVGLGDMYTASEGSAGTAATGEPFVLMECPPEMAAEFGMNVILIPLSSDIALPVVFSIIGKSITIHKLDEKYLPDGVPYYIVDGTVSVLPETTSASLSLDVSGIFNFVPNNTYVVNWNGTDYECVAQDLSALVAGAVLLGNGVAAGMSDTGEPFRIIYKPDEPVLNVASTDGSSNFTVSIVGYKASMRKIDERCLPELPYSKNIVDGNALCSLRTIGSTEESNDYVLGTYAFAEGRSTTASGNHSHAEGYLTKASGESSHAEGRSSTASGESSHAEGYYSTASGESSHAEGYYSSASGESSHAEGYYSSASGKYSHAEGYRSTASGDHSHAEGTTTASGSRSHAEGDGSTTTLSVTGDASATTYTIAKDIPSISVGRVIRYGDVYSKIIEYSSTDLTIVVDTTLSTTALSGANVVLHLSGIASGESSHAEGFSTASGKYSHAEGGSTIASGSCSHAEGYVTKASGVRSHAEGYGSRASATGSHAEGYYSSASGESSHAEGYYSTASGKYSHAEGYYSTASGESSHAEGYYSSASGESSHAEGRSSTASGESSHAEGYYSTASGESSHAEGYSTVAASEYQHAQGKYNIEDTTNTYAHIVGNGASTSGRSNAHTLDWDGNAWYQGTIKLGGTSYDDASEVALKSDFENLSATSMHGITTAGDGAAYTATVAGITALTAGVSFIMVPHTNSTSTTPTLNVNSLGAKGLRMRGSTATGTAMTAAVTAWLASGRPVQVTYNGIYWLAETTRPVASDLSGTVAIANGGTGATTAEAALTNLGLTTESWTFTLEDGSTVTKAVYVG